jgi:hypothetical protein
MNVAKTIMVLEEDLQFKREGVERPYTFAEYVLAIGALRDRPDDIDIDAVIPSDIRKIVLDYRQD